MGYAEQQFYKSRHLAQKMLEMSQGRIVREIRDQKGVRLCMRISARVTLVQLISRARER